jgi:4-azaleucine resistance transporter AzlC
VSESSHQPLLPAAFAYSFPVFLGYIVIGIAFGILVLERGYPWYLASFTGIIMYAGAGQFIALGLFAAGASLAEAALIELMVNARHIAYGITMLRRFKNAGIFRFYLIFALTDETFALLSSLPVPEDLSAEPRADLNRRIRFMFLVSLLNQCYWNAGILIGVLAGSLIPWDFGGVGFALTALFIVLMIEQIIRVKRPAFFIISALTAVAAVFILPGTISLLSAMVVSLCLVQLFEIITRKKPAVGGGGSW